jgi:peroxiredoxin
MKIKLLNLLLIAIIFMTGCQRAADSYTLSGEPVNFSDYRGRYIVINYFASWCSPCWQEVEALNAITGKAKVFGVNYDKVDVRQQKTIAEKMGIKFSLLREDPAAKFGIMHISGLPMTLIIDPHGKLVETLMGAQSQASLEKNIGL